MVASQFSDTYQRLDEACFNPLHCGAVVASPRRMAGSGGAGRVSIPFIAGQWSLLIAFIAALALVASFQSPSLRGSGRFKPKPLNEVSVEPSFNPLHCGAVVASYAPLVYQQDSTLVSIPFIAGQWSLRVTPMKKKEKTEKFQSPSLRGSGRFQPGRRRKAPEGAGFNPLHCGAVVASISLRDV